MICSYRALAGSNIYTVKVIIYAGGYVRVFYRQTIRMGIKYADV